MTPHSQLRLRVGFFLINKTTDMLYLKRVSESFRGKDEMLVPFERLHCAYQGIGLSNTLAKFYEPIDKIRYTVDFVEQVRR